MQRFFAPHTIEQNEGKTEILKTGESKQIMYPNDEEALLQMLCRNVTATYV